MASDFSAVYVRLMQGALVAQLSKDLIGEAQPSSGPPSGGVSSNSVPAGSPDRPADTGQAERGLVPDLRTAESGISRQAGAVFAPSLANTMASRAPSDVIPDQLETGMREAADQRPTAGASDMVQRLRLAPAASLTLSGLPRPLSMSGEMPGPQQAIASAAAPTDPPIAGDAGQRPRKQPTWGPGDAAPAVAGSVPETDGSTAGAEGGGSGDGVGWGAHRRTSPDGVLLAMATSVAGPQGQATPADRITSPQPELYGVGMEAKPGSGDATDSALQRTRAGDGQAVRTAIDATGASRAPVVLSPSEASVFLAAEMAPHGADGVPFLGSSTAGTLPVSAAPVAASEAFLAAIAMIGNRADQAVSRDMLSAVILNAAMIPGWPFPRAIENPARSMEANRAAGQLAAAGAEEFKLTPEEMIAYLTSIGANARLLKALQDLFARVERKEAVQLMAWLFALTSALREIEKSLEDLLRKGTRLPEWAEDVADQIRKGLSRRQRYQI